MNRHTLIRAILTILCSLLLFGFTRDLNNNPTVFAQNTVEVNDSLKKLSSQENEDLDLGKVVLKRQREKYLGQVLATGSINTAWEVLTDYDNCIKKRSQLKLLNVLKYKLVIY